MIYGTLNPEKIWHENLTDLSTSPVICSHFTLGDPKTPFLTVLVIHASDYLCYLRRKQTCPPHLKMSPHCETREMQNFFIWLKVLFVPSNVGGSEKSQLWVGVSGSEKNRLRRVTTGMSGKQRHSKCSKQPPSSWIHASTLFRHWSIA